MKKNNEELKNIFDLWKQNGEHLPFKVKRNSWSPGRAVEVVEITDVKKTKTGLYGKAWTVDDWYSRGFRKEISCAGCYQWEFDHGKVVSVRLQLNLELLNEFNAQPLAQGVAMAQTASAKK
jgi:hypothetical protein